MPSTLAFTIASTMKEFWRVLNEHHVTELKQRETLLDVLNNVVLKRLKEIEREMLEEKKMVSPSETVGRADAFRLQQS